MPRIVNVLRFIAISVLLCRACHVQGQSRQIPVCADCTVSSVEKAVSLAQPGDTLMIFQGTYAASNIKIEKPLTILGQEGAILDGGHQGYVLMIASDNVTISGLTFIHSGRSYTKDYAAIYAYKVSNLVIDSNWILDPFFGILLEKSRNATIKSNHLSGKTEHEDDSGNGIHLWHCTNILVADNEISGLRDGIYLEFVDKSEIVNNHSHHNIRYGLHFMFSNHDQYTGNLFENNGAGVAVMFSKHITMHENTFLNNWGSASYGLLLKEIYDTEVVDNKFQENTIGIFTEGSTRVNYTGNDFVQNGWAVKVSGGCYLNIFEENNFVGNSFDVAYHSKMNDNKFENNYWSAYTGYDLDKNGIGDVPYRPVKLFSYVINRTPETIVLLRSLFVDLMNFSEKVSPVFTPDNLVDNAPQMNLIP